MCDQEQEQEQDESPQGRLQRDLLVGGGDLEDVPDVEGGGDGEGIAVWPVGHLKHRG